MSDARSALRRLTSDPTQLEATCLDHGVALVTAFGSVLAAAGEPKDLDLGVLFDRGLPAHDILGLIGALTDITGFDGWDIMVLNSAGPVARERALIGSTVLFEQVPGLAAREQLAAMLERMDTDWLRRAAIAEMMR